MNKPSKKKYIKVDSIAGLPKHGVVLVDGDPHDYEVIESKPSKKTEWEKARKDFKKTMWSELTPVGRKNKTTVARHTTLFNFYWSWIEKELIPEVLHQRDNEIREKIQGMRKGLVSVRPEGRYILHQIEGYNNALDDLLTYLSNNNK